MGRGLGVKLFSNLVEAVLPYPQRPQLARQLFCKPTRASVARHTAVSEKPRRLTSAWESPFEYMMGGAMRRLAQMLWGEPYIRVTLKKFQTRGFRVVRPSRAELL